jgi:LEA14-like dessication related protein
VLGTLGACASLPQSVISQPEVALRDVQVMGLGFKSQTFLLSFDIYNPNPFPLPVNHISYGVRLDGHRFASGNTPSNISVPASGDTEVAISVDLNLLATAPQLLSIIREGARGEIPYEIEGQLGLDLPLVASVRYQKDGRIRLNSSGF